MVEVDGDQALWRKDVTEFALRGQNARDPWKRIGLDNFGSVRSAHDAGHHVSCCPCMSHLKKGCRSRWASCLSFAAPRVRFSLSVIRCEVWSAKSHKPRLKPRVCAKRTGNKHIEGKAQRILQGESETPEITSEDSIRTALARWDRRMTPACLSLPMRTSRMHSSLVHHRTLGVTLFWSEAWSGWQTSPRTPYVFYTIVVCFVSCPALYAGRVLFLFASTYQVISSLSVSDSFLKTFSFWSVELKTKN